MAQPTSADRHVDLTAAHAHLNRASELVKVHGQEALAGVIGQLARFVYDLLYPPQPAGEYDHDDESRG